MSPLLFILLLHVSDGFHVGNAFHVGDGFHVGDVFDIHAHDDDLHSVYNNGHRLSFIKRIYRGAFIVSSKLTNLSQQLS